MKARFRYIVLTSSLVAFGQLVVLPLSAAAPPNFLFLIADDQAYETIGALGHTDIDTPNLDRLVQSGTTFPHAYNMGGWPGTIGSSRPTFSVSAHPLSADQR